ncbi:hypothetical protein AVEN_55207-1 [Araneus ventricosus]|uniref:Uncharacterized protein n=1 Tax=Araneus ventricosus TaxID=182803 RepID=A0A4Y2G898_ARAVE|nr:hypothetical protein AVEN_55207-1 [Araneus ventricosus]
MSRAGLPLELWSPLIYGGFCFYLDAHHWGIWIASGTAWNYPQRFAFPKRIVLSHGVADNSGQMLEQNLSFSLPGTRLHVSLKRKETADLGTKTRKEKIDRISADRLHALPWKHIALTKVAVQFGTSGGSRCLNCNAHIQFQLPLFRSFFLSAFAVRFAFYWQFWRSAKVLE